MKSSIVGLVVGLLCLVSAGTAMAVTQAEAELAKGYADVVMTYATGDEDTAQSSKDFAYALKYGGPVSIATLYSETFTAMQNDGWNPSQISAWMAANYTPYMTQADYNFGEGGDSLADGISHFGDGNQQLAYYLGFWLISAWGLAETAAQTAEIDFYEAVSDYQLAALHFDLASSDYATARSNLENWNM